MDPNETLGTIRATQHELGMTLFRLAHAAEGGSSDDQIDAGSEVADAAVRLSEQVKALDEWLSKGGFAPRAWQLLDVQWRDVVGGAPDPLVEHGLDWKDLGHAYQGRCECEDWSCGADTLVQLLALYELHLRAAGVPKP